MNTTHSMSLDPLDPPDLHVMQGSVDLDPSKAALDSSSLDETFETLFGNHMDRLLELVEAEVFDVALTVKHIEAMALLGTPEAIEKEMNAYAMKLSPILMDAHSFPLLAYLIALYEYRHLDTPFRSFLETPEPPSRLGFNLEELCEIIDALLPLGLHLQAKAPFDYSALDLVCECDDVALLEQLLNRGMNPWQCNQATLTSLHFAAHHGRMELATLLLERGLDANFHQAKGQSSTPPLNTALRTGNIAMMELLVKHGAHINLPITDETLTSLDHPDFSSSIKAPLLEAVTLLHLPQDLHLNMVSWLLAQGADVNASDDVNYSALHRATQYKHLEIAKLLLLRGAKLNTFTLFGDTEMHIAAGQNQLPFLELFMSHGGDDHLKNLDEMTPYDIAKNYDYTLAADYLRSCEIARQEKSSFEQDILPLDRALTSKKRTAL